MDVDPDTWRWIWLVIAAALITGEMFVAGTFILIPFGISAAVAMVLAFFGAPLVVDWIVFVGLGGALFSVFWRRSRISIAAMESPPGAGHDRLIGAWSDNSKHFRRTGNIGSGQSWRRRMESDLRSRTNRCWLHCRNHRNTRYPSRCS